MNQFFFFLFLVGVRVMEIVKAHWGGNVNTHLEY